MKRSGNWLAMSVLVAGLTGCSARDTAQIDPRAWKEIAADAARQAVTEMKANEASADRAREFDTVRLAAADVREPRDASANEELVRRMVADGLRARDSQSASPLPDKGPEERVPAPAPEESVPAPQVEAVQLQVETAQVENADPAASSAPEPPAAPAAATSPATVVVTAAAPAVVVVSSPPAGTVSYFYDELAPHGRWIQVAPYGPVWQPSVAALDVSWRPYCHGGSWVWTDAGWYWNSTYPWGWATFHYGRWAAAPGCGWVWVPDTVWAPSWVQWDVTTATCGWAPLPPEAHYAVGIGFSYCGAPVSASFHFGLSCEQYTYVPCGSLLVVDLPTVVVADHDHHGHDGHDGHHGGEHGGGPPQDGGDHGHGGEGYGGGGQGAAPSSVAVNTGRRTEGVADIVQRRAAGGSDSRDGGRRTSGLSSRVARTDRAAEAGTETGARRGASLSSNRPSADRRAGRAAEVAQRRPETSGPRDTNRMAGPAARAAAEPAAARVRQDVGQRAWGQAGGAGTTATAGAGGRIAAMRSRASELAAGGTPAAGLRRAQTSPQVGTRAAAASQGPRVLDRAAGRPALSFVRGEPNGGGSFGAAAGRGAVLRNAIRDRRGR